jgi:hypothetical protein
MGNGFHNASQEAHARVPEKSNIHTYTHRMGNGFHNASQEAHARVPEKSNIHTYAHRMGNGFYNASQEEAHARAPEKSNKPDYYAMLKVNKDVTGAYVSICHEFSLDVSKCMYVCKCVSSHLYVNMYHHISAI